jgi:hypothetical protein
LDNVLLVVGHFAFTADIRFLLRYSAQQQPLSFGGSPQGSEDGAQYPGRFS